MPALSRTLSRFFAWWSGELAALVPARIRLWWRESDRIVMLSFDGARAVFARPAGVRSEEIHALTLGTADASLHRAETNRRLLQAAGRNFQLLLCLPPEQVLQRTLTLPLAVEENLRQTLAFELDRYTPFRPEQVYFAFRVVERDAGQRRLSVELAAVPKPAVDQGVTRAAALGLTVDGAVLADELLQLGGDCRNFLPAAAKRRKSSARLWARAGMAALSAVLLAVLLAIPPWQTRAAAISLLDPLARAKTEAQETDALRERLRKLVEEHNYLHDKKWDAPSTVLVLEELSKLLPDNTFVIQFDLQGNTVQIQGETTASTNLVETLEKSRLFKEVTIRSLLTKVQGSANDHFHISATLREKAKPMPPAIAPEVTGAMPVPASPSARVVMTTTADRSPKSRAASVKPTGKP
jgi:general secretion pathway protein L